MFVKIEFEQKTDEWHIWRSQGVGSSDISVLRDNHPEKTRWLLWAEKKGLITPSNVDKNPNVRRGVINESRVRSWLNKRLNQEATVICGYDDEYPWRRASFDAIYDDQGPIPAEIKCPSTKLFEDLIEFGRDSKLYQQYVYQLYYQIGLLEAPYGYLVFYCEDLNQMKIFKVEADTQVITDINHLVDAFYTRYVKTGVEPALDKDRDVKSLSTEELVQNRPLVERYIKLYQIGKQLEQLTESIDTQKAETTQKLLAVAVDYRKLGFLGINITSGASRERFNWNRYAKDKHLNVSEQDRKKFTTVTNKKPTVSINRQYMPNAHLPDDLKELERLVQDLGQQVNPRRE